MRISLGSIITAGILASLSVVLFLFLVPSLLGLDAIDITQNMGSALSITNTRLVGTIFLAILGICYSAIFAKVYTILPGQFLTKGMVFGFIIGLFSIFALPAIITTISGILGMTGQITASAPDIDNQFILTVLAYLVFGLTLSSTAKPAEGEA